MSLTLHFHPLSSFCQKVLVGLYELEVPFTKHLVDLANEAERAALIELWPMGKFPVLRDEARDVTLPESSLILEYVDRQCAPSGRTRLLPSDPQRARESRIRDRVFDNYVNVPMQAIVADKLRPHDKRDAYGVEQAKAQLEKVYAVVDDWMRAGPWAVGDAFTLADCSAAPSLFYANQVMPFGDRWPHIASYFARLMARPSFARVVSEAKPYWSMFPG
jgi:glutathione S-transferase